MRTPVTEDMHPPAGFRLDGRTALVTGAGSGTGRAIALEYARAGAQVVLVARTRTSLEETAAAVEAAGGRARVQPCDVTDAQAVRALIGGLGTLDILVNNAGTNVPRPFTEVGDDDLDLLIGLNMRACFVVAQAAARKMREARAPGQSAGVIINVSSQMGHVGAPERSAYCMTKHGLEGLTQAMAVELAPQGIRVVSLAPTFVDTPLIRRIVGTAAVRDSLLSRIPLGRMAAEREVALAAVYLASDAAAMVTGTSLLVDGGWTAQ
jgi:NAD(P)-dependent dehydrogenase (short-subunit alcohol dehydrogenase family)